MTPRPLHLRRAWLMAAALSLAMLLEPALAGQRYMLQIPLKGVEQAPAGSLAVTPSPAAFAPDVLVGSNATQAVTVRNTGTGAVRDVVVTLPAGQADFSQTHNCPAVLAGGAACSITLVFAPSQGGERFGQLAISSTAVNGLQLVPVSGVGFAPAASLVAGLFSDTQTGQTSSSAVTVTNTGVSVLSLAPVAPQAPFSLSGGTCGTTLAPGSSCTVQVSFAPLSGGSFSSPLKVRVGDGASTFEHAITLQAFGIPPSATLSNVDFGSRRTGGAYPLTAVLMNTGVGPLSVDASSGASIAGDSQFALAPTYACKSITSLAPGATCSITLRFLPLAKGAASATLSVTTGAGVKSATVSGVGI